MQVGPYIVSTFNHGFFRLDAGAMFGAVPKNLWSRVFSADEENCIRLATRSLVLRSDDRLIVVDTGNGTKWDEKRKKIFAIETVPEESYPFKREEVTDLILTHLHFDHAGGISCWDSGGKPVLTYPKATFYLQEANLKTAQAPSPKEGASYLPENFEPLKQGDLRLIAGSEEILPNIFVHQVNGHTRGQQTIEVRGESETVLFPTDLIPTSRHLPLPYHMGYDMCAETLLREKKEFLEKAITTNAVVVFEHDPDVVAARIQKDDRGRYEIAETLSL